MMVNWLYSLLFLQCVLASDIALTVTDCPSIELEYHVAMFTLQLSKPVDSPVTFHLTSNHPDIVYPLKQNVTFLHSDGVIPKILFVYATKVGDAKIEIDFNDSRIKFDSRKETVDVVVVHSLILTSIINIIGWIYFVAWSISFYPQVIVNFKRKSVIGLNFDFICYNITGFLSYTCFNVGLFYFKSIQDQYFQKYGGSVIPVLSNDVFFAIHACVLTIVIIIQCFIYERGDQKVSIICKVLLVVAWLFAAFSLIPLLMSKISSLTYLNFFSYIKLGVTLIKYIPQAYMNYQRQSTVGWSIANVLLDFTGGSFSLAQMFLLSYNNNEWNSIFGDFTKFGLGLFSVFFDIIFMLQHYVFYRRPRYEKMSNDTEKSVEAQPVIA